MKPILYYSTLSPPSRAVLLTANAIGIDLELIPINLFKGEHLTSDFCKMNPQHTIPVLDDDGAVIYDSHVICGYLCDKYAEDDRLYPTDLLKRSLVQQRMYFDTSNLFGRMRFLLEPILYYGSPELQTDRIEYMEKSWCIMEEFLKDCPYVCGDDLTIADFCCIASISSIANTFPIDNEKYPNINGWIIRMSELPYYESANGNGAIELQQVAKEKLMENQMKNQ